MSAGVLSQISFGLESTWGTAVVPNKSLAVRPGDGLQANADPQFVQHIKAQLARNSHSFKGAATYEGEYEFEFIPGVAGYLLKSAFGGLNSATASGEAAVYDHTFSEAEAKPSLTVEQATGDVTRRYAGAIVNSLTFACSAGEALLLTAGMSAKSSASASKISPTYETVRPFNFADLGASGFDIGGTDFSPLNFELAYNNNNQMLHALGANDPAFKYVQGSEVTGRFDLYLDSNAASEYADYLSQTDKALTITFTGDSIGSASNNKLVISVPKAKYTVANVPVTEDYNMVSVELTALYDTATSKQIEVILTNETADYN